MDPWLQPVAIGGKWDRRGSRETKRNPLPCVALCAGDLEPLRALQSHAPADGEEGVGVVEPGEDVHGDRPFGHRGRRVEVVEPADLRIILLDAVPRALLDSEKADIAGPDDRCRVLAR